MTDQHHCADAPLDHFRFHESETSRRILGLVRFVDRDNAVIGLESLVAAAFVQANGWTQPAELALA